jgi:hypothetical protein
MAEKQLYLTPKAPAMFPFLTKASTKFSKEGVYKITLVLDPSQPEHKSFLTCLRGHLEEGQKALKDKKAKNTPWKKHLRKEDNSDTGKFEVTFKSQYPPRLFDAIGNKVTGDLNVGNDSIVKVAYKFAPYEGFGGGIAMYLQAVQIIELVEWAGGDATDFGFGQEQGDFNVESRFSEGAASDEPAPTDDQSAGADTESIPF